MNLKKITFALIGLSMTVLFASASFAQTWGVCTPKKIGPYGSFVRLQATNCNVASMNGWLTLSATGTDQMMAAILTAMSLNKTVAIAVDGTVDAESIPYATAVIFTN